MPEFQFQEMFPHGEDKTPYRKLSSDHVGIARFNGREVLTVLNAVFNKSQYWDGRTNDLKDQVVNSVMANPKAMLKTRGGPIAINPIELAATRQREIVPRRRREFARVVELVPDEPPTGLAERPRPRRFAHERLDGICE